MKSVPTVQSEIWEKQRWINNLQFKAKVNEILEALRNSNVIEKS